MIHQVEQKTLRWSIIVKYEKYARPQLLFRELTKIPEEFGFLRVMFEVEVAVQIL